MEEDKRKLGKVEEKEKEKEVVLMWGYLPGVSPDRSPLLHPVPVRRPESATGEAWRDVSGGGCGFAMAISGVLSNPSFSLNLSYMLAFTFSLPAQLQWSVSLNFEFIYLLWLFEKSIRFEYFIS
ncbi:hypothetical protein MA16_Dca028545 [Dendrobium catenatum]|uniref:Uncharacterized protein n=1 Tax=Dendrobium catenatum TaxID=906689 RepID=A0A2I0VC13_9ASPA|nr:hypothetical protein MA16_Dca028545 [Dendrobium catenatum]